MYFPYKCIHIHKSCISDICIFMCVCECMCMYSQNYFKIYRQIRTVHIQIHTIHTIHAIHTYTCIYRQYTQCINMHSIHANTCKYRSYVRYIHIHSIQSNTFNACRYMHLYEHAWMCLSRYLHVLHVYIGPEGYVKVSACIFVYLSVSACTCIISFFLFQQDSKRSSLPMPELGALQLAH